MTHTPTGEHAFPIRVKRIAALLYRERERFDAGLSKLEAMFGPVDFRGTPYPFTHTGYYADEMGGPLERRLVAFHDLCGAEGLVEAKKRVTALEGAFSVGGMRTLNVDVGYLDLFKVVLASHKGRGNKLYLGQGVWADITLTYARGAFHALPWTFPDFREEAVQRDLLKIRTQFKTQLGETGGRETEEPSSGG